MRTIAGVLTGCVAMSVLGVWGMVWWLGPEAGLLVCVALIALAIGIYGAVIGPWHRRWGATDREIRSRMPGDELLGPDASSTTRAITIHARPEEIFPWLLQIGYGRGGWYSYDWIDNDGKPSVSRIDPALQHLVVGDRIDMVPGLGPIVRRIEPNGYIMSGGDTDSWCLLLEPIGWSGTRLISRWRQRWPKTVGARLWMAIVDPGAFVMEQRMLRTIRSLAERAAVHSFSDVAQEKQEKAA
jgi:hypothetical protein